MARFKLCGVLCTTSASPESTMAEPTIQIAAMVGGHELKLTVPASLSTDELQARLASAIKVYKDVMAISEKESASASRSDSEGEGEDIETTDDEVEPSDSPDPEDLAFLEPHPDDVVADELERLADALDDGSEGSADSASYDEEGEWPYPPFVEYDWDGPLPTFDACGWIVRPADAAAAGAEGGSEDGAEHVDADKPEEDSDFDVEEETAAEKAEREAAAAREAERRRKERERPAKTKAGPGVSVGAKLLNVKTGKPRSRLRKVGPKAVAKADFLGKETPAAAQPFSSACCSSCALAEGPASSSSSSSSSSDAVMAEPVAEPTTEGAPEVAVTVTAPAPAPEAAPEAAAAAALPAPVAADV